MINAAPAPTTAPGRQPSAWVILLALLVALPSLGLFVLVGVAGVAWIDGATTTRSNHLEAAIPTDGTLTVNADNASVQVNTGPAGLVTLEDRLTVRALTVGLADQVANQLTASRLAPSDGGVTATVTEESFSVFSVSRTRRVVITMPPTASLVLHSSNGAADLRGLRGAVDVATQNGAYRLTDVDVSRTVRVETVNGAIHVEGRMSGGTLDLTTVNGAIDIRLPADTSAQYDLSATTGAVTLHGPNGERSSSGGFGRSLSGHLGDGTGGRIVARTTTGAVSLSATG